MSKTTLHSTYPQRTSLRMKIIYLFVCFDDQKLAEAGVRFGLEVGPATQSRWIIITWTSMWKLYVDKPIHPQAESQSTIWRSDPTTRTERQLAPLHQIRSSLFFWIWLFVDFGVVSTTVYMAQRVHLRLMARACLLCLIATVRGAFFVLEQPFSSCAAFFPPLKRIIKDINEFIIPCHSRCFLLLGFNVQSIMSAVWYISIEFWIELI